MVARLPKTGWFSLAIFLECKVASPRGPCFDADFLIADSKFMKVAFGVGFKMLMFNPLVLSTKDLSRNLKLTMSNSSLGEDFPTGKDNSIVSTGSTKVIPAGRTILFLDWFAKKAIDQKQSFTISIDRVRTISLDWKCQVNHVKVSKSVCPLESTVLFFHSDGQTS
ncbi:hypothetical protein Tco_0139849 [Tanacetum coccineum]